MLWQHWIQEGHVVVFLPFPLLHSRKKDRQKRRRENLRVITVNSYDVCWQCWDAWQDTERGSESERYVRQSERQWGENCFNATQKTVPSYLSQVICLGLQACFWASGISAAPKKIVHSGRLSSKEQFYSGYKYVSWHSLPLWLQSENNTAEYGEVLTIKRWRPNFYHKALFEIFLY